MKNKNAFLWFAVLALASCNAPMAISETHPHKNIKVNSELAEDPIIKETIAPYKKSLEQQMNEKISYTSVELNKNGNNSNLGNLLADYTYDAAVAWGKENNIPTIDAAVINIGGIRSIIAKGDILLKHIFEVMPFENEIVIVEMKGSDIDELFTYYLNTQKNNPVSKLFIETENGKISKTLINGLPPQQDKLYYIATSDYLALGGDNMKFFSKGKIIGTGIKLRDSFIDTFRKHPNVTAPNDIRLIFK